MAVNIDNGWDSSLDLLHVGADNILGWGGFIEMQRNMIGGASYLDIKDSTRDASTAP
jgi:hypothetical protein